MADREIVSLVKGDGIQMPICLCICQHEIRCADEQRAEAKRKQNRAGNQARNAAFFQPFQGLAKHTELAEEALCAGVKRDADTSCAVLRFNIDTGAVAFNDSGFVFHNRPDDLKCGLFIHTL